MSEYQCSKCGKKVDAMDAYEYRGAVSCVGCFDEVIEHRDWQRNEIIAEESAKTETFRGLDMTDSIIGNANRQLLKRKIEIAGKESERLKRYERGEL